MDIMISSILEQVLTGVGVALAAVIAAGIRYLFARQKNERLREYGDLLAGFAEKAVKSVAQAEADALKEADDDGKLTDDEKAHLKALAVDTLKSIAPDAILKFSKKVTGDLEDLDTLLGTLIESAVRDSKEGNS